MKTKTINFKRGEIKMKKILAGLALSSALLLTACGTDAPEQADEGGLQDGTYKLEELNFGGTGWKEGLEIVVDGGEITDATWSSVNEEGTNKIEDDNYQETMMNTDGVGPQDFIPGLEEALVEAQDPADVEVISGATGTSEKFVEYAEQVVEAAEAGNTDTIEVDNAAE